MTNGETDARACRAPFWAWWSLVRELLGIVGMALSQQLLLLTFAASLAQHCSAFTVCVVRVSCL